MPRLVVLRGPAKGTSYELGDVTTIGRASTNTIQIRMKRVSREHLRIERHGDRYVAIDLDSVNGIYVNGKRTTDHILQPNDKVLVGTMLMVFEPPYGTDLAEEDSSTAVVYSEDASTATATFETVLAGTETDKTPVVEELLEANRKLKALYEVSDTIFAVLDLDELLRRILDVTLGILRGDRGVVLLYSDEGALKPAAVKRRKADTQEADLALRDLPVSRTILDQVARDLKAVLTADAMIDPRFNASDSISNQNIRSVMCVPLLTQKRNHGLLYVDICRPTHQFREEDLRLLTTIARQAATAIANARSYSMLQRETVELRRRVNERYVIIGSSKELQDVLEQAKRVAAGDSTVLITGETGTGKELIARAIHEESPRDSGPFITVNCAAVPETLLESELFGHVKGAFTGAHKTRQGMFERANHGTLFMDEIGEVAPSVQSKLLRVVENRCFTRVGGTQTVNTDVRIIAATNRDLESMVSEGGFRQDLYYRLAVVPIAAPPLRERTGDIPELVTHFVKRYIKETGKRIKGITEDAMAAMAAYNWPGNVRELQNVIERAVILTSNTVIGIDDLPENIASPLWKEQKPRTPGDLRLASAVGQLERHMIGQALQKADGKKIKAARLLDISRPTLDKKMKDFGLEA